MVRLSKLVFCLGCPVLAFAQQTPEIAGILDRLDKLEQENRTLKAEVQQLKSALAESHGGASDGAVQTSPEATPQKATVDERLAIQESRVEEQAQTKVEASQKFPITLSGMALFNAYYNTRFNAGQEYPSNAALTDGGASSGGTLRQSIVGLEFRGPHTLWGGYVHGSLYMDFFTGGTSFNSTFRLRTGVVQIDWKNRNLMVGIDKPIFNPLEPASLAQSGISPLTGAGNLWLWMPQVRFEQDVSFSRTNGLRARVGVVQTHETTPYDTTVAAGTDPARPGFEGRFEFYHNFDDERRIQIAPGFHFSDTHSNGLSIPSNVYSLDLRANPWKRAELTGVMFTGRNVSLLGTGLINQGFSVYRRFSTAIQSRGGWAQLTLHTTRRTDVHLFSGIQYYGSAVLTGGDAARNFAYGANVFYRIAPNVIFGPEIAQIRTVYIGTGTRLMDHYDLALAYMF